MDILIGKADLTGVYARFATKSTQVCVASVTTAEGFTLDCAIWARLSRDKDSGEESITIEPGFSKGTTVEDENTRDEIKALIMEQAQVWAGFDTAQEKAIERLTAEKRATTKTRLVLSGNDLAKRRETLKAAGVPLAPQSQHDDDPQG